MFQSADHIRQHILRNGLDATTFEWVAQSKTISFKDIFGKRSLLIVEFGVLVFGEHSHVVYTGAGNAPAQVITSYPEKGVLRVAPPTPWYGSRHSPSAKGGQHRVAVIHEQLPDRDWEQVCYQAQRIDEAGLNYHFLEQNSNSVAATLLSSIGLGYRDLKGGGFNFGARNLLHDELDGGRQSGRLLFRRGASYLGHPSEPTVSNLQALVSSGDDLSIDMAPQKDIVLPMRVESEVE
jgi:hypothetical protein